MCRLVRGRRLGLFAGAAGFTSLLPFASLFFGLSDEIPESLENAAQGIDDAQVACTEELLQALQSASTRFGNVLRTLLGGSVGRFAVRVHGICEGIDPALPRGKLAGGIRQMPIAVKLS